MERKTQKNGVINLLALVLTGAAGFAVAKYGNTLAGLTGIVFLGMGALVAAVSWFQMRLEERGVGKERCGQVISRWAPCN